MLLWSCSRLPLPEPPPHSPPAAPAGRCDLRCLVLGGMGIGTCCGQAERALDWSNAAIRIRHAKYSRGRRRQPAAGLTARPCVRSDWASRLRWGGQGGLGCFARWAPVYVGRPSCLWGRGQGPQRSAGPAGRGAACRSMEREGWRAGARCRPGGRGHGPPEWRCPAGPSGWVAPGLCAAPEIPALGGRNARPRAELTPPPPVAATRRGARGRGEGLAEEVLVILVSVKLQAQVEIDSLGLGIIALLRQVPRGRLLHGEEGL